MASKNYIQTRSLNKRGIAANVVDDTPVALRITHIDDTAAVSAVTVATAASLTLTDGDNNQVLDITAAATDTLGELADTINATTNWRCKILDGKRTDTVATSEFVDGAITLSIADGEQVWDVKWDTSVHLSYDYRLTHSRNPAGELGKQDAAHRVHLREILYFADINAATADGVQVWECKGTNESQIYSSVSVDAAATTINWAGGAGTISGGEGADLLVRVKNTTSLTDHASGSLRVAGEIE